MNNQPLVSIILPTYNRASTIGKTLESIVNQRYANWELLVVDDGSKDNTKEVMNQWMNRDGRIKFIELGKNAGASAARNVGIEKAAGEFITFIDSDDRYAPDKVKRQVEQFTASDLDRVGIITCGRRDFDNQENLYKEWVPDKRGDVRKNMFRDERIGSGTPFLMVRRSAMGDEVRFDANINVVEDFDFLMQILQKGYVLDYVASPLVDVYHYDIERNFSYERAFDAREYLYKKYEAVLKDDKKVRELFLFKTMVFYTMFRGGRSGASAVEDFKRVSFFVFLLVRLAKMNNVSFLKSMLIRIIKYLGQ